MKRLNPLFAALVAAGIVFAADAGAQTLQKVADANRITVSYRESAVPFSYQVAPGKAVGFAVDLAEAVVADVRAKLKRPGLEVAYMPVTGQNRIPLLVNGTYDLECGSTTNTAARGKEVTFAISHFYAGTRVLVRKGSGIRDYTQLAGKPVAVVAGSTNEKVLRAWSDERRLGLAFVPVKDYGDGFRQVEINGAVAFGLDDVLLYGLRANAAAPNEFEVVGETLQVEPYGCMLRKDDPEFKQLVDATLARLMKSGEFTRLYGKWFESPIPPNGVNLGMPMGAALAKNLQDLSDKPAP